MASSRNNLSIVGKNDVPDGTGCTIGIIVSDWNSDITHALLEGCVETLMAHNVEEENIYEVHVPGSFELPFGASQLIQNSIVDAVICLGCVIKGDTPHDDYINQAVAQGIMNTGLSFGIPVVFGVLTTLNEEQALERAGGKHGNKGVEAAMTALKMIDVIPEKYIDNPFMDGEFDPDFEDFLDEDMLTE